MTPFKILNPFNISGMDEATLFNKFSKRVDYSKSNTKGKIPCETGVVWAT